MKKTLRIALFMVGVLTATTLIAYVVMGQTTQKDEKTNRQIPADVLKIAERSCVKCHTEPGNNMALMHLNLSNWEKYSGEKQAAKAKDICKMVSNEKMPPKKFRTEHPDGIPTADEIKTFCDWAQSLQGMKK
jgi:hypothetical protein